MAISKIAICNQALSHAGANTIQAITESTQEAQICNLWYDSIRRQCLAEHPWNFAIRREALALLETAPVGFVYGYRYPNNCIRIMHAFETDGVDPIDYGVVYTSSGQAVGAATNTLELLYVHDVEDTNAFSPVFVETLALRLGVELSYILKADVQKQQFLMQRYGEAMQRAKRHDAQEMHRTYDHISGYEKARIV